MAKFQCNFISYSLERAVDVTVIVPSLTYLDVIGKGGTPKEQLTHQPREKYPVLYLLHGVGNNHMGWTGYTNVELFAEERNIVIVMPSGENKSYADQPKGDHFMQFIRKELPDFVCGMFPVSQRPEDTYLAGLSMGGYGTLINGLAVPERYRAIGAFSPAVHINPDAEKGAGPAPGRMPEHDPFALATKLKESPNVDLPIYLSCGEEDFLFELDCQFRDHLRELGLNMTWSQTPGYGHEWRFWNEEIEKFLDWLPRTDPYAGGRRKC